MLTCVFLHIGVTMITRQPTFAIRHYSGINLYKFVWFCLLLPLVFDFTEAAKENDHKIELDMGPTPQLSDVTGISSDSLVSSPSTILPYPLFFKKSEDSSFEEDKNATQTNIEQLYLRNNMFKCKFDFTSKQKQKLYFEFKSNADLDDHGARYAPLDHRIELQRNAQVNDRYQSSILHMVEHGFVTSDNKLQNKDFTNLLYTSPFDANTQEEFIMAARLDVTQMISYLEGVNNYESLTAKQQAMLEPLKEATKNYRPLTHKIIVTQKDIDLLLKNEVIDHDLNVKFPNPVQAFRGFSAYLNHCKKDGDRYILNLRMTRSTKPNSMQAALSDALFIINIIPSQNFKDNKKLMYLTVGAHAQEFGIYPGLVEFLMPRLTEFGLTHRDSSYSKCYKSMR